MDGLFKRGAAVRLAAAIWIVGATVAATAGPLAAATLRVDPGHDRASDENRATADAPLRTVAAAIARAKGGDTILLADGVYPGIRVTGAYEKPLTIAAAEGARPRCLGAVDLRGVRGVRVRGLDISWPAGGASSKMAPFVDLAGSRDIEIAGCTISDSAERTEWRGMAVNIDKAERVAVRDCRITRVYFGVNVNASEHVTLERLDIGPWTHEDGIRVTECLGPVLIDGCHITNTGVAGSKGGHVDAIQVVFWSDNLTIRNCHIHGVAQAIGAFHCVDERASIPDRRRRNWRIEGNLIHDVYTPHACTICETDGVVVVNNTFPHGFANLYECTGGVVKNNIFGSGHLRADCIDEADYNLWTSGGTKVGEHDLLGADAKFANAATEMFTIEHSRKKDCTRTTLYPRGAGGKLAVGDKVEVVMTDGRPRDGTLYEITAVGDGSIEIAPPLPAKPTFLGVLIYTWPEGHGDRTPDYRLRRGSPAIDSADGGVERGKDRAGHSPADEPDVKNTGAGDVPYLDRGALEFVPE